MALTPSHNRRDEGEDAQENTRRASVPLIEACRDGRKDLAKICLKNGSDINEADHLGRTALHVASLNGHTDVVLHLVDNEADVNARQDDGATPLMEACKNNHHDIVRLLLIFGAHVNDVDAEGKGALVWAIESGYTNTIVELIRHPETDVNLYGNGSRPLHAAVKSAYSDVVELLFRERNNVLRTRNNLLWEFSSAFSELNDLDVNAKDANGDTPLHLAARCSYLSIMQILLLNKADVKTVNHAGNSAFHVACGYRASCDDIIKEFVDREPDVNAPNSESFTGLHLLTLGEDVSSIQVLLNSPHVNVDVDAVDGKGRTALFIACERGYSDIASELQDHGANVNTPNTAGCTPLHIAIIHDRLSIVAGLLDHPNINMNARDGSGKTVLCLARELRYATIAAALICRRADVSLADDAQACLQHTCSSCSIA